MYLYYLKLIDLKNIENIYKEFHQATNFQKLIIRREIFKPLQLVSNSSFEEI